MSAEKKAKLIKAVDEYVAAYREECRASEALSDARHHLLWQMKLNKKWVIHRGGLTIDAFIGDNPRLNSVVETEDL